MQIVPLDYDLSLGTFSQEHRSKPNIGALSLLILQVLRTGAALPSCGYPKEAPCQHSYLLQPACLILPISQSVSQDGAISTQGTQKFKRQTSVSSFLSHCGHQPNVPRSSQLHPLCLTPTWVSLHPGCLTSCSRAGALLLCAYLEPRDLPFLKNNTTFKFKVMFILEVLNNVGKNN